MAIKTTNSNNLLIYETLYSNKASGSVFSPQKYTFNNQSKSAGGANLQI